jgi:hypothetical protein
MRLKAVVALILMLSFTIILSGCSPKPEEVVHGYYQFVFQRDFDNAYKLLSKDSQQRVSLDEFKAGWNQNLSETSLLGFYLTGSGVQEDKALIGVSLKANNGYETFDISAEVLLIKQGSNWRIVLSENFGKSQ